ncbi:MAG: hypothetical protein H6Q78_912 [Candidatus Krumholzibacteriota bacterium]|nr:hypothetical protein [Candidatus Krumholzibacteriota bacterium]
MKWLLTLSVVAAFLYPGPAGSVTQYNSGRSSSKGVSLALHDPIGSVYRAGEEVGLSLRTDTDAYVVVFDIDTDGFVHLLYPEDGKSLRKFSSGRAYEFPDDPERSLVVGGSKGIEFMFALAVEDRDYINEQEVRFLADNANLPEEKKFRITGDPFLGANRIASQIVRGIAQRPGVTMSFTYFYIDEAVDYPRYLCDDCYEKGTDPYASGMPAYAASADFEKTERLTYPLEQGFARDYPEASTLGNPGSFDEPASSQVTKVYVSYYPRWDTGFYDTSWWYLDPWYSDWWYTPYPGGFYFSFGWGNWWGCHYSYFPYYYGGSYYPYYPYYWYPYDPYPYYPYYPGHNDDWRSFRPVAKDGATSDLYRGLTQKSAKDIRSKQVASVPGNGGSRTGAKGAVALEQRRTGTSRYSPGGKEARVIRSRPTGTKGGLEGQGSREIHSKTVTQREQRVITRSPKSIRSTTNGGRSVDTRSVERKAGEIGRRAAEPRSSGVDSSRPTSRPKSDSRAYTPNTRRDSGSHSATQRSGGGSSSRGSSSRSGSSPSGKSSGSSRGKR